MKLEAEKKLRQMFGDAFLQNEPLKKYTTFRIGGPARYMVTPENESRLAELLDFCREASLPYYIIGNGSNLLVSDQGFDGLIIRLYQTMDHISVEGNVIRAGSGALLVRVAATACEHSLSGLEFASGIPGTIGGAIIMNAGAYGGEMKDVVTEVRVMTREGEIKTLSGEEMAFGYRSSEAARQHYIVLEACLTLKSGTKAEISSTVKQLTAARKEKQPLEYPSAGSTFKRPEGYFAGKLIDDAGLRGFQYGGARVSDKHCGFVVNVGEATAADVMSLICQVQNQVYGQFGVRLEPEVKFLGDFERDVQ